jgi:hypothetical protein
MCLLVLRLPTQQPVTIDETNKQSACRTNSIALIKPERIDVPFLVQISDFCYGQVRGEDLLSDFYIRKLSFVQQQSDTRVLLWMVVAITISGVLLAGFSSWPLIAWQAVVAETSLREENLALTQKASRSNHRLPALLS